MNSFLYKIANFFSKNKSSEPSTGASLDFSEYEEAPGWDAIDEQLAKVYLDQKPKHWGTNIPHMLGGEDPLDGISVYECQDGGTKHLHFCTYGFSSLYESDKPIDKNQPSGYGFELTFRLKSTLPPKEDPVWVLNALQAIAKYVFSTGNTFVEYGWMSANGPINSEPNTELVGFVFLKDPVLKSIDTSNGYVEFLQMFGINQEELDSLKTGKMACKDLIETQKKTNPLLVTDLSRKS